MEKISEMIERMCPEGVTSMKLLDIAKVERGKRVVRKELSEIGKIPVYQNSLTPLGFAETGNYSANTTFVISAGAAGEVGYSTTEYWGADDCLSIICNNDIDSRFLYYFLKVKEIYLKSQVRGGAMKRLSKDTLEELCIPLPPLPIQQKIVHILDTFTQLQSNLEAELAARQKQYEYYRNKLLTFDEDDESVGLKTLGEATIISRGKRVVRKDLSETGSIPVYQNSLKPLGYATESNYPANTPFVISAGAAGEVGFSHTKYWGADDCFSILSSNNTLLSRFIYHWLKIKEPFLQSQIRGGAIKRLSRDVIENLPFPCTTLQHQQEIVTILDTFEFLITNLKQEIDARKKQYEYYREQLLSF